MAWSGLAGAGLGDGLGALEGVKVFQALIALGVGTGASRVRPVRVRPIARASHGERGGPRRATETLRPWWNALSGDPVWDRLDQGGRGIVWCAVSTVTRARLIVLVLTPWPSVVLRVLRVRPLRTGGHAPATPATHGTNNWRHKSHSLTADERRCFGAVWAYCHTSGVVVRRRSPGRSGTESGGEGA